MSVPGPTNWTDFDHNYTGTDYGDANGGISGNPATGNVTWGRDQKFFGLSIIGPSGTLHTIGLLEAFDETESTNSDFLDVAGTDQLEYELGTPRWNLSLQRMAPRGADMRQMMRKIYPNISTVDWRFLPLIVQGDFQYKNPVASASGAAGATPSVYEAATWQWHKCFVQTYRNILVPGTRGKMREEVSLIASGVSFFENGAKVYESNPYVWNGQFFTTTTAAAAPGALGAGGEAVGGKSA